MKGTLVRFVIGITAVVLCTLFSAADWIGDHSLAAPVYVNSKFETVTGEIEVAAECEGDAGEIRYFVKSRKERLKVKFASDPKQELKTGMLVTLNGRRRGGEMTVYDASVENQASLMSTLPNTFGEQKILVLLVNFLDNAQQPWTTTQATTAVFDTNNSKSVTNFLREVSYNQTWATGNVNGWYGMPINSTCDTSQISSAARQAAQKAGINLGNYNRFIYVYPGVSGCGFSGWANIPGNEVFLNGVLTSEEIEHEIGHSFGLYHAHRLECGGVSLGSNCSVTDKGNMVSTLGYAGATGHYYSYYKERLGWLNYGGSPPITTVTQSGTYTLSPMSVMDTAPKALKIQRSNGTWYYVEYRRAIGFDSYLSFTYPNSNLTSGVVVSMNDENDGSKGYQLDMTPGTTSWADSALVPGSSYTDQSLGVTISTVSVSSTGAVVNVSFNGSAPACVLAAPTVAVSPATVVSLVAGSSANYAVTVTNNNSASCTANSFNLQAAVPAGWSVSSATPIVSVAPGSSVSASVQIGSPAGQADGMYSTSIGAANSQAGSYSASLPRDLSVFSSVGVTVSTDQPSYATNQTVTMTAKVTANGTPVSGATVNFTIVRPNGNSVTATATTSASGAATYGYRINKKQDPAGTYSVAARSTMNGVAGSGVTTFMVR